MSASLSSPSAAVTSVAGVIAQMQAIGVTVPSGDGLACFNRMYLQVTCR